MKRVLHTVNQSPFDRNCLQQCLDHYHPGDAIVLLENGVYAALQKHSQSRREGLNINDQHRIYALKRDLDIRGLDNTLIDPTVDVIQMQDFVTLCTEYDLIQSWY